jgi:hypothetical protein
MFHLLPKEDSGGSFKASTIAGACVESMANSAGHVMHIGADEQHGEFGSISTKLTVSTIESAFPLKANVARTF